MGCYVEYRGKRFEAKVGRVQLWMTFVLFEIKQLPEKPSWLAEMQEFWQAWSTEMMGDIQTGLDDFLTEEARVDLILMLSLRALERLRNYGEKMSQSELNKIYGVEGEPEEEFLDDIPTAAIIEIGEDFCKLLRGT